MKNKIAAPFKTAEIAIVRKHGIDNGLDIVEAATLLGLITKAGAFYTIKDKKAQGKEKAMTLIMDDPKLREELEKEIQNKIKEMRIGKPVLDEKALEALEVSIEEKETHDVADDVLEGIE